eukprot:3314754-Amphidinium_carterae.3
MPQACARNNRTKRANAGWHLRWFGEARCCRWRHVLLGSCPLGHERGDARRSCAGVEGSSIEPGQVGRAFVADVFDWHAGVFELGVEVWWKADNRVSWMWRG